jgi:hypothetical protein
MGRALARMVSSLTKRKTPENTAESRKTPRTGEAHTPTPWEYVSAGSNMSQAMAYNANSAGSIADSKLAAETAPGLYIKSDLKTRYTKNASGNLELAHGVGQEKGASTEFKTALQAKSKKQLYKNMKQLTAGVRAGDPKAIARLEKFHAGLHPDNPKRTANKERLDGLIRDKAAKREGDMRGTGNDEMMLTSLFQLMVHRESGLAHGIEPVSVADDGSKTGWLQWHEHARTSTALMPLVGGKEFAHPGYALQTASGSGFYVKGNHELDKARAGLIIRSTHPAQAAKRAMAEQVNRTKKGSDIASGGNVGYDRKLRNFAESEDARNESALETHDAREVRKRVANAIARQHPNVSDADVSDDDETVDKRIDGGIVEKAARDPELIKHIQKPLNIKKYTGNERYERPNLEGWK